MALFDDASLVVTPNGYKAGTLYSIKPTSGAGDMTVVRATTATRVNSAGLIESVANNVPRLDYSNGSCPSLLVEPQRTNIQTYSEDIAQAFPTILGGTTTANNTTSPSGIINADKFTVDTSTGIHGFFNTYVSTNGQSYTTSVFLKRGTGRYFLYRILTNTYEARYGVTIDLETGTILGTNTYGTPTGTSSKIEDYGNGWYRVSLTINGVGILLATLLETSNTATPSLDVYLDYSYTGNGTDTYFIWGLQTEAGSYPTSYIPTTSAAVTRNADVISKTGISSLLGAATGSAFVEFTGRGGDIYGFIPISLGVGLSNLAYLYVETNNRISAEFYQSGVLQAAIATGVSYYNSNNVYKAAFAWANNDFVLYINGTQIGTDSSGTAPTPTSIRIGNYNDPSYEGPNINSAILFPTRLTNAELASLTTL
jgi:hypothetical protein